MDLKYHLDRTHSKSVANLPLMQVVAGNLNLTEDYNDPYQVHLYTSGDSMTFRYNFNDLRIKFTKDLWEYSYSIRKSIRTRYKHNEEAEDYASSLLTNALGDKSPDLQKYKEQLNQLAETFHTLVTAKLHECVEAIEQRASTLEQSIIDDTDAKFGTQ